MAIHENQSQPLPVIIVGGGMTGLSAAWELQQQGVPYVLLEASGLLGGKVETTITDELGKCGGQERQAQE